MSTYEIRVKGSYVIIDDRPFFWATSYDGFSHFKTYGGANTTLRLSLVKPTGHDVLSAKYEGVNCFFDGLMFLTKYSKDKQPLCVVTQNGKISNTVGVSTSWSNSSGKFVNFNIEIEDYNSWNGQLDIKCGVGSGTTVESIIKVTPRVESYDESARTDIMLQPYGYFILTCEHKDPTITNLTSQGEFWEKPISINWRGDGQQGYEYECYYNNVIVFSGNGGSANTFTIPSKTFSGTLPSSVRVRTFNIRPDGVKVYSGWSEKSLTLKDIDATIANLIITGEYWEKDILLTWRSENQEQFKVQVLKNNVKIKEYAGTTDKQFTVPSNELTAGEHSIIVSVAYQNRYVNSTERNITLKDVQATVKDLALSGSSIDLPLTFSWVSTDQQNYEYEIYKDSVKVKNGSGTTATSINIANNTLTTGLHKFMIRVAYKDRWTTWEEINVNLVETLPSIGVLEPDGVIVDKDYPTRIWWTSQNQTKWKIILDGGTPIDGTWQTEYIIPGGTLQTGKHNINLTVTYVTGAGVEKTAFKNAEFIVQGKPPIPTFTNSNAFTTSRPTFSWDTQDQQGYVLEILKDDAIVWTTEWQNGLVTRQKVFTYLENGTYVAKLKIINQFSIESDYGKMTFTVNANESTPIMLSAKKQGNAVVLSWDNTVYKFDKFYIIRNGYVIGKTTDTLYTDHTAFWMCEYTVRGINASDIYKDSNSVLVDFVVDYSAIATVDALDDMLNVSISKEQYGFGGSLEIASSTMHMHGRVLPVTIFGAHETNTFDIVFNQKHLYKFAEMFRRRQVLCYRDKREKLFLSISNPSYSIDATGYHISVSATQVDYIEVIEYD